MTKTQFFSRTRRRLLLGSAAAAGLLVIRPRAPAAAPAASRAYRLIAQTGAAPLLGAAAPRVPIWGYDGRVPGPEIRVRQGERLRVTVENRLQEDTTVHWHGVRLPNAMDGVPHVTQKPIAPGARFIYEFVVPDAGTYWYHPHHRGYEQVDRGLHGPLIVEEREPPRVDRDITWVLDDWRLTREGQVSETFGNMRDVTHNGRIGNTITVNGLLLEDFALRAGERIRLRLINAANARIFGLEFSGHEPIVIALDGQPVTPHAPPGGRVVLGPAMRCDLILDAIGKPGSHHVVRDMFYKTMAYELLTLRYGEKPLRAKPRQDRIELPQNPLSEPDLELAQTHVFRFQGGMMGNLSDATLDGKSLDMRQMMQRGKAWAMNGVVAADHTHEPLLALTRGRSYIFALRNDTAWHHPMHLHGHSFRVIRRNGQPTPYREWLDTVLMNPEEQVDIAFVADNPGDWMFHCHILEHQEGGMMGVIRVA
jgi:FtsP/CotA-like multicopper oxidase with cupredoxin domain